MTSRRWSIGGRWVVLAALAAALMALAFGCGDPLDQLIGNDATRGRVLDKLAANPKLSGETVDRLLMTDSTRKVVLDRLMSNTEARQAVLIEVARDRTLMEGAIQYAVQDSSRRDQLKALFRGMEMGGGR